MINELYKRTLYTAKAKWIIHEIFEYDISKANISILLQNGCITDKEYVMYSQMGKLQRQIAIGNLQKNPKYSAIINAGFEKARKCLIQQNNIAEDEIVSIKKDALCVLRRLDYTDFGNIHFSLKSVFSMFIMCMKLEIYFYYDERNDNYDIQIKGISDDLLPLHETFMSILCEILRLVQQKNLPAAMQFMTQIRQQYSAGELPIECYREFNVNSSYRLKGMDYGVLDLSPEEKVTLKPFIETGYNNMFLLELHKILMEMMFTK